MFSYALNYDPLILPSYQVNAFIDSSVDILNWYQPFNGTYIIISNLALSQLTHIFSTKFSGHTFLLVLCSNWSTGGIMPKSAWDFINSPKPSTKRQPISPLAALFDPLKK